MDNVKTGQLICKLRKEKNMTQQQLADILMVSPKTISKWETGAGCPDISVLPQLAAELGVSAEQLLKGSLQPSLQDGGNMKRVKFYRCETCGNVLTGTGEAEIICCGRKLDALKVMPMDDAHTLQLEQLEDDYFITAAHDMIKEHFITFVAWASFDRVMLVRLYPEQNAELRMHLPRKGDLYVCCSKDGLFRQKL